MNTRFWLLSTLVFFSIGSALSQPTAKPGHGVSVQLDVVQASSQTACVFISIYSEQPVSDVTVHGLQENWVTDHSIDCRLFNSETELVKQIEVPVNDFSVQVSWQLDSDVFSSIQRWSAFPTLKTRQSQLYSEPVDTDELFIIRIGE